MPTPNPTGQRSPLLSFSGGPTNSAGTYYTFLCANLLKGYGAALAWGATEQPFQQPIPVGSADGMLPGGGMLQNFYVNCSANLASKYTFTIYVNGFNTGITVNPAGTGTTSDTTHTVLVNQGDLVCIQCVQASGAVDISATLVQFAIEFVAYGANQSLVLGGNCSGGTISTTANTYASFQGVAGNSVGTDGPAETIAAPGTLKNLYIHTSANVSNSYWTVTLDKATVPQTLTATVSSGADAHDTTHTVAVAAGNSVTVAVIPGGSTATAQSNITWGFEFDPTTAGYSLGCYDITPLPSAGYYYNGVSGSDYSVTEADTQNIMPGAYTILNLYGQLFVPIASNFVEFTLRKSAGPTALTCQVSHALSISPGYASDTTDLVSVAAGDLVGIQTVSNVSATTYSAAGLVFYASSNLSMDLGTAVFSETGGSINATVQQLMNLGKATFTETGGSILATVQRLFNLGKATFGLTGGSIDMTLPIVPFSLSSLGAWEYGAGTASSLPVGNGSTIVGPFQCQEREQMQVKVHAESANTFNLNYEFSTDKGTTWYVGQQVPSSTGTADDASGAVQQAHGHFNVGYWWRINLYNTDSTAENIVFEWRLHSY